jgi:hypothetical protein
MAVVLCAEQVPEAWMRLLWTDGSSENVECFLCPACKVGVQDAKRPIKLVAMFDRWNQEEQQEAASPS